MKIKVHLKDKIEGKTSVCVLLDVDVSENFIFECPATIAFADKEKLVGTNVPNFLTYEAVEAAFRSGALYARHKVGPKVFTAKLMSFSWDGPIQNPIPFAVATTVGIYEAIAGIRDYTENELSGWIVVKITPSNRSSDHVENH